MRIQETKVYQFGELSDSAKDKARDWYRDGALGYEWWESVYEDAARIGLKITGFDLGGRKDISGRLTLSALDSIEAILREHWKGCDTYSLAEQFKAMCPPLQEDGEPDEDALEAWTEEYEHALKEEYRAMLEKEEEYLQSDESVDESIIANEYEFTENGKRA